MGCIKMDKLEKLEQEFDVLKKEFDGIYNKVCENHAIPHMNYIPYFDLEVGARNIMKKLLGWGDKINENDK